MCPPENDGKILMNAQQAQKPSDNPENRPIIEKLCLYFCIFIQKVVEITKNRNLLEEFKSVQGSNNQNGFENFARQISMVIISVLKGCIRVIEELTDTIEPNPNIQVLRECVKKSLEIMVQTSQIPEDELFKISLDFWHFLTTDVMQNPRHGGAAAAVPGMEFMGVLHGSFMSMNIYPEVFAAIEQVMVDFMVKPKEVLIVIDENGEAVEEVFDDTEIISVYETMRETLVYLTNIDKIGVERVI